LLVVLGVIAVLAMLAVPMVKKSKAASTSSSCARNLADIGVGMLQYAKDHTGNLPPGRIHYGEHQQAWDSFLDAYLPRREEAESALVCPADPFLQQKLTGKELRLNIRRPRRSYAMPAHNMLPNNWPPGPKNATGIGLDWTPAFAGDSKKVTTALMQRASDLSELEAVGLWMIPEPGDTLMLTEQIASNNIPGRAQFAVIRRPAQHVPADGVSMESVHGGQFNYLRVDGHVELLSPRQTLGPGGDPNGMNPGGMWTIKPND
jgi:prepilin-type processing-associated H-X9-DG protein